MICVYCQREFDPSKYRKAKQRACGDPECQKRRQRDNLTSWQGKNPLYYRIKRMDPLWRSKARARARRWRLIHTDRIRAYRQATMDQYRIYMREYMRRYRAAFKAGGAGFKAGGAGFKATKVGKVGIGR